ncbi:MAG: ArsR/SmtB family transcription factor [Candidatus Methanofastidiosia archaeon]
MVNEEELFNILGNETRRMILKMLASGPCYTTEIADRLNIGQKAINEHMRLLQNVGLVDLYVQKQIRGSPRKYFKIKRGVRMEFVISPYRFATDIDDFIKDDFSEFLMQFPRFKDLEEEVTKTLHIQEIERFSRVISDLKKELERISDAKEYIEHKINQVRQECIGLCDELELDDNEKRVVLEVVSSGGVMPTRELSERLKLEEEEIDKAIGKLKEEGILKIR